MPNDMQSASRYVDPGFTRPSPPDCATPFIEVDSHRLDRNIAGMQAIASSAKVVLRPHVKTHKSLEVARRQIAAGARGLTASKASEAEIFLEGGFKDILMAYPVVRSSTIARLLHLARDNQARVAFIAADSTGVAALNEAALAFDMQLPIFLKVDVGLGRVGVKPAGDDALRIAREVDGASNLRLVGLLAHAGHAYGAQSPAQIADIAAAEIRDLLDLRTRLTACGLSHLTISTGSTPTALGAPIAAGADEIRPGNYTFLDLTALRLGIAVPDDLALSVVARVVAVNETYAIIDAGSKTLSSDHGPHGTGGSGFGKAIAVAGDGSLSAFSVEKLSEEHGFLRLDGGSLDIGDLVRIFPNHSCAVVALSDHFMMRDSDGTARSYKIDARGKLI